MSDPRPFHRLFGRLYAVCARFPKNLEEAIGQNPVGTGVYEHNVLGLTIRIIVANRLPLDNQAPKGE